MSKSPVLTLSKFLLVVSIALAQTVLAAENKKPGKPAPKPAKVTIDLIQEKMISSSSKMLGIVDFDLVSNIASEVGGIIEHHNAGEGTRIKRGDVLATINTDFVRQDIKISATELEQVMIELTRLKKNLDRLESLLQTNTASKRSYENALYGYQAQLKKGDVLNQKIERLKLTLEKSKVRAPFDGVVIKQFRETGEWSGKGKQIARIASTRDVVVRVAVSEDLLPFLRVGEKVPVELKAYSKSLDGRISELAPVADLRSKSVYVKIQVPYFKEAIQNMSASVEIPVSKKQLLRIFKRSALIQSKGKNYIYAVEDSKAKILPVNIVARMGEMIGVNNPNIKAGMRVIVDGSQRVRPNQPLIIVEK